MEVPRVAMVTDWQRSWLHIKAPKAVAESFYTLLLTLSKVNRRATECVALFMCAVLSALLAPGRLLF